jgi:hypothetical protein
MSLIKDGNGVVDEFKKSVKYGVASELVFGNPESEEFDILESITATQNYGLDVQVKGEGGFVVGSVLGDPKVDLTMNGMHGGAPFKLGVITKLASFVTDVAEGNEGDGEKTGAESATELDFVIKSVQQDNSNEDFMKFTVTGEHYYNMNYSSSEKIDRVDNAFDSNQ